MLAILWLAAADLRAPLLATPPLLPLIHRALLLDEKGVAILTTLPTLLFATAAVPGSLFVSKLGARRATLVGLLGIGLFAGLRGVGPSIPVLFGSTFLMGLAIAVIQPAFPSLVRQWFTSQISLATALYSNGLLVGESVAAAITIPLVLPLTGGSWEVSIGVWGVPALAAAVLLLAVGPQSEGEATPEGWWPRWNDPNTWLLGVMLGIASMSYWVSNSFLPDFLRSSGREGLIPLALAVLNVAQFPSTFAFALWGEQLLTGRWAYVGGGILVLAALLEMVLTPGAWPLVGAAVIGFTAAIVFVVSVAIPALAAEPQEVHRLAAALFTITYTFSFVGPLIGGALWDATHVPETAFAPPMVGALAMLVLSPRIRMPKRHFLPAEVPVPPVP